MQRKVVLVTLVVLGMVLHSADVWAREIGRFASSRSLYRSESSVFSRLNSRTKKKKAKLQVAGDYSFGFFLQSNSCDFSQRQSFDALIRVAQQKRKVAALIPGIGTLYGKANKRGFRVEGKTVGKSAVVVTTSTLTRIDSRDAQMDIFYRVIRGGISCEIHYQGFGERV